MTNNVWYAIKPNQTISYLIYMYKENLELNNLQWLICHKTQPSQTKQLTQCLFTFTHTPLFVFYAMLNPSCLFNAKFITALAGDSPSDCLELYLGHSFGEPYTSAEMKSVVFCIPNRQDHTVQCNSKSLVDESNGYVKHLLNSNGSLKNNCTKIYIGMYNKDDSLKLTGLVWFLCFCGISILVGYQMPKSFF